MKHYADIVGIMPAAGLARRIAPIPCSKELFPVGFQTCSDGRTMRTKVVSQYLLEKMKLAGADNAYVIIRNGKWDIPSYFGDGHMLNMNLAYLMMRLPYGTPYTIDQAYPFVKDSLIVFGFPDILFEPDDAFQKMIEHQTSTQADIVLGLFLTDEPRKMDMVELNDSGKVKLISIKPQQTHLKYTWIIAVWSPVFTAFMHDYLLKVQDNKDNFPEIGNNRELYVGDVVQEGINRGLQVEAVIFSENTYIDIGTPEDLLKAARNVREGGCHDNC